MTSSAAHSRAVGGVRVRRIRVTIRLPFVDHTRPAPAWGFLERQCMRLRVMVLLLVQAAAAAAAGNWPQWRGPNRDGISPDKGLLQTWPEAGPRKLFTATGMGIGFSSVAVTGGR